jgi:hypothetical protein
MARRRNSGRAAARGSPQAVVLCRERLSSHWGAWGEHFFRASAFVPAAHDGHRHWGTRSPPESRSPCSTKLGQLRAVCRLRGFSGPTATPPANPSTAQDHGGGVRLSTRRGRPGRFRYGVFSLCACLCGPRWGRSFVWRLGRPGGVGEGGDLPQCPGESCGEGARDGGGDSGVDRHEHLSVVLPRLAQGRPLAGADTSSWPASGWSGRHGQCVTRTGKRCPASADTSARL